MFACDETIDMLSKTATNMKIDCKFIVIGKHPRFPSLIDVLAEVSQEEMDNFSPYEPENPIKELGIIFFSSGTTGNPKGIMRTFDSFAGQRSKLHPTQVSNNNLRYANISWTIGMSGIFSSIRRRSTQIIHKKFDPEETSKVLQKYEV